MWWKICLNIPTVLESSIPWLDCRTPVLTSSLDAFATRWRSKSLNPSRSIAIAALALISVVSMVAHILRTRSAAAFSSDPSFVKVHMGDFVSPNHKDHDLGDVGRMLRDLIHIPEKESHLGAVKGLFGMPG